MTADFSNLSAGESVEGMGVVAPDLNIDALGTAVKVLPGTTPLVYGAPNTTNYITNGGLSTSGGFSDATTKQALGAHQYTFTFAPGVTVNSFSLHMLDYGDFNPTNSTYHLVNMVAYNTANVMVAQHQISYTSTGDISPLYGDLIQTGDAIDAVFGQPGNWTWNVSGTGITRIVLDFGVGHDPNIAFDSLTYTTECLQSGQSCQLPAVSADYTKVGQGESVEGMGMVAPDLNIDALGTAVKVLPGTTPLVYGAPNTTNYITNGGLSTSGGFSDATTKQALGAHQYTFTFAPGVTVNSFSLHMLDYGDFNPTNSTSHLVTLTAYNASNLVVSQHQISYTSTGDISPLYGDLIQTGDAIDAVFGQPGNWTWGISGTGITRIVLDFGVGHDPNIAFDALTFTTDCP